MRAFGIRKVFGNPGSTELPFLADWPDDIDYVLGLQEASVVGMADGYAQATRNAGFVNLHSAAGVGNALGNIFTAHRNQTPLVITAGQQARSILPLQAFLYAERASEFPRPYVKFAVEPARAEDVPAAIARAYYVAMQPPCGPTFVSVPIDDWTHPDASRPGPARQPRARPRRRYDEGARRGALGKQAPCPRRRPRRRSRAGRRSDGDALRRRRKPRSGSARFRRAAVSRNGIRNSRDFFMLRRRSFRTRLRGHDLVVVIGAPAFTFHVEGHASIFDGATTIFQITDDPTAAAVTPVGTSIIATMKPALTMLIDLLPETRRAMPAGRMLPPAPRAADPIPVEYLLHTLSSAMPDDAVLVEEAPSHRPAMQKFMPMRGQDSFYTMASGGLGYGLPAAVGMALGRPGMRTVCLIGDGSAMYSIQALWTAAQRKLPLTVVVINNSGYGAMRSFSQVMQVRNVPGLDLPGIDFVEDRGRHGLRRGARDKISGACARAEARPRA